MTHTEPLLEFATGRDIAKRLRAHADNLEWNRRDFDAADAIRATASQYDKYPDTEWCVPYIPFVEVT